MNAKYEYIGDSGASTTVIFDIANWDNGGYMLINSFGQGMSVEFLVKYNNFTMTSISSEHTINGTTITLNTGSWYSYISKLKIY